MTKRQKRTLTKLIVATSVYIIAVVLDLIFKFGSIIPNEKWAWVLPTVIYGAIFVFVGYKVVKAAFSNLFHGYVLDENFLMTIASIGAFIIGDQKEGVAVVLLFCLGEWFQSFATERSRKSIKDLMELKVDFANVINADQTIIETALEELKIGDTLLIKQGDKVPTDVALLSANACMDLKAITGESMPVNYQEGDFISSGAINMGEAVTVKVSALYENSTVAKILEVVENASKGKTKTENFIARFAKVYTPCVIGVAVVVALLGGIITKDYVGWIYKALNFLVVSCPCALVISVPLTFFTSIGEMAKQGVLVKGSVAIENLSKTGVVVFDKTGTITKGELKVINTYPEDKTEEIMRLAEIAESASLHPISRAILGEHYQAAKGYTFTEVAGEGVIAIGNGETIVCGNNKLMEENGITIVTNESVGTIIYVAKNGEFVGSLVVGDTIKDEAKEAITTLKQRGIKPVMLSGDHKKIAEITAAQVGIGEVYAELLPNQKVEKLNELKSQTANEKIAAVGDGINDAPLLISADVGVSMGTIGADSAIEASDVVILKDNLSALVSAQKTAKNTMKIAKENVWLSLIIKFGVLAISLTSLASMWLAIFADVGVSFIAILNALRKK